MIDFTIFLLPFNEWHSCNLNVIIPKPVTMIVSALVIYFDLENLVLWARSELSGSA
jgi:hypothetical protein